MGIDISEQMIRYAQKLARHLNLSIRYRQQDVCQMEFADQSFDIVACQLLLHTLPDPLAVLREMYRVARPSARIVVTEPVESSAVLYSADADFCQKAAAYIDTYVGLAALGGMDFNLSLRLPSLLIQAGWRSLTTEGFMHTFWKPPEQRQVAQTNSSKQLTTWKQKLLQVAELPIFESVLPDDLLTTFSVIIATGERRTQMDLSGRSRSKVRRAVSDSRCRKSCDCPRDPAVFAKHPEHVGRFSFSPNWRAPDFCG